MKIKRKEFSLFNLSFLDIISCGFGAVVLLVLISNNSETGSPSAASDVENLLSQLVVLENAIDVLADDIVQQKQIHTNLLAESNRLGKATETLSTRLNRKKEEENSLQDDLEGLALVQETLKRVSISPATANTMRDEEVGGIPVDSNYVVFIVDTSSSMRTIWNRVSGEILNVLSIHPRVKGFQILNDQGTPLISGYSGRWIPDTPQRRESVMRVFGKWQDASNSSPVEGIEAALKQYAKPGQSTAIYVFGDDYTGSSYDQVIAAITRMNGLQKDGRRMAKIHAVGFISQHTSGRFAILMRELTRKNGGTFLALPL